MPSRISGLLPRLLAPRLTTALSDTPVVLIHGSRQCGKTTLARMVGEPLGHKYISFDDDAILKVALDDPSGFVADLPERVILDEVQRVPRMFTALKVAVDERRVPGRFILTGSANVLLVPKLAAKRRRHCMKAHEFDKRFDEGEDVTDVLGRPSGAGATMNESILLRKMTCSISSRKGARMTTMFSQEQTCAVCGKTSTQNVLGSTNTMGPSDLDMRPAPMARWTLDEQVQCCPHCGYCAWDISEATEAAGEIVANEVYRVELARESVPELTRRYLCASLILSADGNDAEAGQAALMGAWAAADVADQQGVEDAESTELSGEGETVEAAREAATRCRRLAIAYLEADRKRGLTFAEDEAAADALLADLHRRVGDFDAARALARAGIARRPEGLLLDVLRFQVELAESEDVSCHNLGEIGEDDEFTIIMPG